MIRRFPPKHGDKVHDYRRKPNANGSVIRLIYEAGEGLVEVYVKYDDTIESYPAEEFEFCWTDRYGGTYILDIEP